MNSIRSAWTGEPSSEWRSLSGRASIRWQSCTRGIVAPMVGDGMDGSPGAIIREARRGQAAFMAPWPEEPPGGSQSVRSSEEAGNDRGAKGRRKVDA